MSLARRIHRLTEFRARKLVDGSEKRPAPDNSGKLLFVFGTSQVDALASLRSMPVPPAPPGSPDSHRDEIDPLEYRREMNARKRSRRTTRAA